MPEGHTIHGIARDHRDLFAGGPVAVASPQGRFGAGASRLDGRVLEDVAAHGKHLLYHFEGRRSLHVHLGLVGRFRTFAAPVPPPSPAARLALGNDRGAAYLSGPMTCALLDRSETRRVTDGLGPDPLAAGTRVERFLQRVEGERRPIGAVLLDQSVIAGIGNVYRAEILFLCGLGPHRPAGALEAGDLAAVWRTARELLRIGLDLRRIVTVDPRLVGARSRREIPRDLRLYVYDREHRPCRVCRTPIRSGEVGGRRIWWCPSCQG